MPDQPTICTTGQLAEYWGCNGITIVRLCREAGLPHTIPGTKRRQLDYREVLPWIAERMHLLDWLPKARQTVQRDLKLPVDEVDYRRPTRRLGSAPPRNEIGDTIKQRRLVGTRPSKPWIGYQGPRRVHPLLEQISNWHAAAQAVAQAVRDRVEPTHGAAGLVIDLERS